MPLTAGARFGVYEILTQIGAGGMGVVYQARDTRLERVVALKVLPEDKSADHERRQRFLREARTASALNHPNIVIVYDVGSEEGIDYLAMEYVAGKTLDQIIPRNGMRFGELLRCAAQMADALARAHQAGIVHRDLKPGNVMVTAEGVVKVLDFGLARMEGSSGGPVTADSPTMAHAPTQDGMILGTANYMSPEQAEARPADPRSDIFSFGVMLYEMATGSRPFTGNSQIAVMSAILREDPKPPAAVREEIPAELVRVIARCLRKDPARRFQHMADLKVALEELKEESDSGTLMPAPMMTRAAGRSNSKWIWAAAGAVVLTAGLLAGLRLIRPPQAAPEPTSVPIPLTSYTGRTQNPSFSPDGNQIAFAWNGEKEDNYDIYVKLIGPGAPLRLTTDPADDFKPAWSPDGRSIAFVRGRSDGSEYSVIMIPALGGPERRVGKFLNHPVGPSFVLPAVCWTRDSKALIVSAAPAATAPNSLTLVPLDGGAARILTHPGPDQGDTHPGVSWDNSMVAFVRTNGSTTSLFVQAVSAAFEPQGELRQISNTEAVLTYPAWIPRSHDLLFGTGLFANPTLWRTSMEANDVPRPVPGFGAGVFDASVSAQGNRIAYTVGASDSNIWQVDLKTRTPELHRGLSSSFRDVFPQFSPDGKRIAFYSNRSGTNQIWIADVDGSQATMMTSMPVTNGGVTASPRWSPDGQQIAFDSNTSGSYHVYTIAVDGGQPKQITQAAQKSSFLANWSHDGRWIYYSSNQAGNDQIWKIPAQGGEPVQVTHGGGIGPSESPDGKTVYFVKESGAGGLWKVPAEGGEETQVVPDVYRTNYVVTANGIYFTPREAADRTSSLRYLNFATGATTEIVKIPKPLDVGLGLSPDGRTILYSQTDYTTRHLMMVENFH